MAAKDSKPTGDSPSGEVLIEEVKSDLITLRDYTNQLGKSGINEFAYPFIEATLKKEGKTDEPRTYAQWEKIYLSAQAS